MKRLAILGSTGSIGTSTLDVLRAHPEDFSVVALAGGSNLDRLEQQVREFAPAVVAVGSEAGARELARRLGRTRQTVVWGEAGLAQAAAESGADLVVSAVVGGAGLVPTMAALSAGKTVALANKESLVMAGELMTSMARQRNTRILPVDSEHSAIFQCLNGHPDQVQRLILTASGGPFRQFAIEAFARITPQDALRHPTWSMGKKITIDSATLLNKGLEVIEAHWLFGLPLDRVDVIVHPQSVIHSMVEYVDGSVLAQLGVPDMRVPIQYALTYPERRPCPAARLSLAALGSLTFEPVDTHKFPALSLAYEAARGGGSWPTVLNAANEVAVQRFLDGRIGFDEIPTLMRKAMDAHPPGPVGSIAEVLDVDRDVRRYLAA
ncbi:MAG TPA: 1-deoxy-D-xylulose-5-phosphate reductoisomerase [Candidatus Baltobacteraceae bacterium]|nr:1-deoxy-D-xylulose-5-phosphate reductoisomerase [Candidatus Baltobacteraceae bacterium]